ncbi:MAG: flagellar biosynthetic protein FliO, partial [Candidatus Hydrogenedentes bacterium]|nr:flagellar biosynthetic protein FliO [Candidatus Hydrogenedentota bacterium]
MALLSILLWAPFALAQIEPGPSVEIPTSGEALQGEEAAANRQAPGPEDTDPAEADFIGRINDAIDLRGFFVLCIVIALILIVYYGLWRWGKKVPLLAGASLGTVLGRIHLERGTTLHFLRTGGRVLIVGVNGNAVSLVADFDASA